MSKEYGEESTHAKGSDADVSPTRTDTEKGISQTRATDSGPLSNNREVDFRTRNGLNLASFARRKYHYSGADVGISSHTDRPQVLPLMARSNLITR